MFRCQWLGFAAFASALHAPPTSCAPDTPLLLRFGLRYPASGLLALERKFWEISTPGSPAYGRHLTRDEADDLVRPPASALATVIDWIRSAGCADGVATSPGGDWVSAALNASCAKTLLRVPCLVHRRASDGAMRHTLEGAFAALPPALAAAIAVVAPAAPPRARLRAARGAPSAATTPSTIRAAYRVGTYKALGANTSTQQVAGFLDEFAEDSDLQSFFQQFYPSAAGNTFKVVGPNGAVSGVEAALDVQYIMSVGDGVPTTFWYTDAGSGPNPADNEPYLAWLLNVTALKDADLPNTISVSYSDDEDTISPAYAAAVEVLFKKLGARGTSMLHASGDGGVSGAQGSGCLPGGRLRPTWPASSPYITSVGATDATYAAAAGFSAGGFSNLNAPASYQTSAIAAFFAKGAPGMPSQKLYNATGRGIPDVSAVGEGFMIVSAGQNFAVDGTSCSTPTFAGIVALLNDARVFAGKPPLGFLVRGAARALPRRPRPVCRTACV